jgi:peptidoglycan/xylan/chitin deacetylase (PgdA/CDA1 family)
MWIAQSLAASFAFISAVAAQQCQYYNSPYTFPAGQYPTIWQKPNATVFNTAEFQSVYNSINWSKVPNIPPKTMVNGVFVDTNYSASDPDCWWSWNGCVTPKFAGLNPDTYFCAEPDTWGLTYDDGPNCTNTVLYDFLKANNQKATMFYIGSNVADWPEQAQRGLADGHQICVHTWSHPYMTTLTNQEVLGELYYTRKAIKYVLGVTPLCWRPPYGDVDDRVRAIAQQLNLVNVIWNQDTDDWQMVPAGNQPQSAIDANYQSFITKGQNGTFATNGTIVLSHELNNGTMSESIKWYPQIRKAYQYVVPVATCMNWSQPYAETNITYPTFAQLVPSSNSNSSSSSSSSSSSTPGQGTGTGSTKSSDAMTTSITVTFCLGLMALVAGSNLL